MIVNDYRDDDETWDDRYENVYGRKRSPRLRMEYDVSTGESYPVEIKYDEEVALETIRNNSPKMFYTPDELKHEDTNIRLYFDNFSLVHPIADTDERSIKMTVYQIMYTKVHFRNTKHKYLFVQDDQMENFRQLYLGEKARVEVQPKPKCDKIYI